MSGIPSPPPNITDNSILLMNLYFLKWNGINPGVCNCRNATPIVYMDVCYTHCNRLVLLSDGLGTRLALDEGYQRGRGSLERYIYVWWMWHSSNYTCPEYSRFVLFHSGKYMKSWYLHFISLPVFHRWIWLSSVHCHTYPEQSLLPPLPQGVTVTYVCIHYKVCVYVCEWVCKKLQ